MEIKKQLARKLLYVRSYIPSTSHISHELNLKLNLSLMDPNTIPSGVSSSPVSPHPWKYDVFLSSGEDTRNNFTSHLYSSLAQKGIKTFRDEEIRSRFPGQEIAPTLLKAIEESRVSLIILSENYAGSSWCLDELVLSLECRRSKNQMVIPIFYKVDPSDVRHLRGGFGEAFAGHELRFRDQKDKVMRYRDALREVVNLSGFSFSDFGLESTFIHQIVEDISKLVFNDHTYLNVAKYPIGIADPMIEDLIQKPLLNVEETRIWMHDMMEEIGEEPQSYRMATSTAWIFLLTNIGLEISSAMFDQFSSPSNNPQGALISMVLAILAVIISIWELIHKGVKERVKYKRQIGMFGWFYSHSGNKIFGSVPDMCGLLGAISQCAYATVQYVCILRHIENPYKIYLWPIIFLLCLGASRLQWNQRNLTRKLKQ